MSERADEREPMRGDAALLAGWRERALSWLRDDPAAALRRAGLLDGLFCAPPGLRAAGDQKALAVCYQPSLVPNVAFEATDVEVLWRLLQQLLGAGSVGVAAVDDPGRLLLRRVGLVELELPRLQLMLADAAPLRPPVATRLGQRDRPAIQELVRACGGMAFALPEEGEWYGIRQVGLLVAVGSAGQRWPGLGEICNVMTHPAYRRQGYAATIISTLSRVLLDAGLRPSLEVFPTNEGALHCYRQLGFAVLQQVWRARFVLRQEPAAGSPEPATPALLEEGAELRAPRP